MAFTKINAAGIGTTETVTVDGLTVINDGSFGGNLTVSGVLTYEDVTNVDSVGLITARNGIVVGSGITLSKDGDIFATGVTTSTTFSGSGANLTNLPAANITGTLPAISGANLTGVLKNIVEDTSPQLGGGLESNGFNINFADSSGTNNMAKFGASGDLQIYHDSVHSRIVDTGTGDLKLQTSKLTIGNSGNSETMAVFTENGAVELYHDNVKTLYTDSDGVVIGQSSYKQLKIDGQVGDCILASSGAELRFTRAASSNITCSDASGSLNIIVAGTENAAKFINNGAVELYYDNTKKFETTSTGADFTVASGEVDIYSAGSGTQHSLRLLNADASTGNEIGIYFGPANNVAGAFINGYSEADFSSNANRSASLRFGVRNAGTLFECAKFTNGGFFQASNSATYDTHSYATSAHQLHSQQRYFDTVWIANTNANYERSALRFDITRSATSSYHFITATSGALTDDEFRVRGDGQVYADGSFNGGGADYAEYFEWTDGNSSNEDRRGMTVVLDGSKVRLSTSSDSADNIIGVVSGRPTIIGDSASERWTGKYQKDDYNEYILDSDGYRQLSPSYDDTKTYVPREERQEWDTIGMVGKLRIRKGQQTGTRWIKMRDVSDAVEEWLVR